MRTPHTGLSRQPRSQYRSRAERRFRRPAALADLDDAGVTICAAAYGARPVTDRAALTNNLAAVIRLYTCGRHTTH